MKRNIRVRGIRRKQIDEDKLALAFLLLAKIIHEQKDEDAVGDECPDSGPDDEPEAA